MEDDELAPSVVWYVQGLDHTVTSSSQRLPPPSKPMQLSSI